MEVPKSPSEGVCDHVQPADVARLGEEFLQARGIKESDWNGCRFGMGGPGGSGPFKTVYIEVERRNGNWVAVKLERSKEDQPPERAGFKIIQLSDAASAPGPSLGSAAG